MSGSTLYVGGDFSLAGGSAANDIAKWNGSSWLAFGSGLSGRGYDGNGPYVLARWRCRAARCMQAEISSSVGGTAVDSIAKYNGSTWSGLGSGMNYQVNALAVSGSTLYAGGYFTTAAGGSSQANFIAHWTGSSWLSLGGGSLNLTGCECAGRVGQHFVCGRLFHDGGGGHHSGPLHCAMEREQLVGPRFGDERRCVCAGGFGQHVVCGRQFHDGGRHCCGQLHREMEWKQLVGPRFGDERRGVCAWRYRAAPCMRVAISRRRAAIAANEHRAMEREYVYRLLGSGDEQATCLHWLCRAARCMRAGFFTTAGGSR